MLEAIEDRNLAEIAPLPSPRALKRKLPVGEGAAGAVLDARRAIRDLVHGRDRQRLLVITGPCSIHDREAALDYARRLRGAASALRGELVLVMRTYFEKPRTTVGWKGLVNDPHLDGRCDVAAGLEAARALLLELAEMGVACATEVLDPFTPQYLADLLAWSSIGARTVESQTHRQLASGLSMPVGFKNATDGRLEIARHAMVAAGHAHAFLGITAEGDAAIVRTRGNPDRHLILRGGASGPNYAPEAVARAASLARDQDIARPVLVDCSHDNSEKDPSRQGAVCRAVLEQFRAGEDALLGVMLESHLHAGRQDWEPGAPLRYGVSITDACIDWEETETLLLEAADAVKRRG